MYSQTQRDSYYQQYGNTSPYYHYNSNYENSNLFLFGNENYPQNSLNQTYNFSFNQSYDSSYFSGYSNYDAQSPSYNYNSSYYIPSPPKCNSNYASNFQFTSSPQLSYWNQEQPSIEKCENQILQPSNQIQANNIISSSPQETKKRKLADVDEPNEPKRSRVVSVFRIEVNEVSTFY